MKINFFLAGVAAFATFCAMPAPQPSQKGKIKGGVHPIFKYVTVRLPEPVFRDLQRIASADDRPLGSAARRAIMAGIEAMTATLTESKP